MTKTVFYKETRARLYWNILKMKCPIKEEKEQIAFNKGPRIFNQGKKRPKKAKSKDPGVSHKRKHCLTWGE